MTDDQAALAKFDGVARLFPLPNLVFFPQVVQALHVFEPRYRQMLADAIATDQLIALVALKEDWEDTYDGLPEVEEVACLGRITQYEVLPDGRYNLRLRGLVRLRLEDEVPSGKLYRQFRAEAVPDILSDDLKHLTRLRRQLAEVVLPRFEAEGPAHQHLSELFAGDMPLGVLCDMLSYALPLEQDLKQALLAEPHVPLRAELLRAALAQQPLPPGGSYDGEAPRRKFPPDFSVN